MTRNDEHVRVIVVEDSPTAMQAILRILSTQPDVEVVGKAVDGRDALALIGRLDPDVVLTDLRMPRLDGLGLTKAVMATTPRPVLVMSATSDSGDVFRLMEAGALDVIVKPQLGNRDAEAAAGRDLASRIRVLSGVRVMRRSHLGQTPVSTPVAPPTPARAATAPRAATVRPAPARPEVVAVGASTGGPQALDQIFSTIPREFPLPILCVQHISHGFQDGLMEWLSSHTRLKIETATQGAIPQPGTVYFPEEGRHLSVDAHRRFCTTNEPAFEGHRPAVDVLFNAVARHYASSSIAVLLTGMGRDGAQGMRAIHDAGGVTIAQDAATSLIFGMPAKAIELGAAQHVLALGGIAPKLREISLHRP